ncbi:WD40 repeat-like protein [Sparassis crispa]|uniref:WD40 repeat-like protein n=1 Tax=Sparassis crispa TaxID=139825 RepID=A0A401GFB4_9APHY|nr:WD40 repeat-like protein [Sparassis crispa]GBE80821.1 WD40 repeat-like protein [Sparassis crispa]
MSGLKNSPFGKRLRASHQDQDEDGPRRNRPRVAPLFGVASASTPSLDSRPTTSESGGPESPAEQRGPRDYGDRFVPTRDTGDMRTSYHLMDESAPSTPSKNKIIPTESDALKEQANAIFTSILHTEVTPPSPRRAVSPTRSGSAVAPPSTPTRRRLFAYNSPSRSNPATPTRRLDTPTDEAYSMSPVRAESRQLLESPRRQLRSVCKTPYRVLDAPELADDFYLNLVDWSSTNVLGVGLGSCVYLWTAHNAAVSKLCDISNENDTISSVSWVQKVTFILSPHLWRLKTYALGLHACRWHTFWATAYIRCKHASTTTDVSAGAYAADWRPFVEFACAQLRLQGSSSTPPGCTRANLTAIQAVSRAPAGSMWLTMEFG